MNCRNSCLGCKKAIVINRKKILVFSALQVVCYRATSHTFKPKLEKKENSYISGNGTF